MATDLTGLLPAGPLSWRMDLSVFGRTTPLSVVTPRVCHFSAILVNGRLETSDPRQSLEGSFSGRKCDGLAYDTGLLPFLGAV